MGLRSPTADDGTALLLQRYVPQHVAFGRTARRKAAIQRMTIVEHALTHIVIIVLAS